MLSLVYSVEVVVVGMVRIVRGMRVDGRGVVVVDGCGDGATNHANDGVVSRVVVGGCCCGGIVGVGVSVVLVVS